MKQEITFTIGYLVFFINAYATFYYFISTKSISNSKIKPFSGIVHVTGITDTVLLSNEFYRQFNISVARKKYPVNLLIIVSTAPARFERRQAIRQTWWTECRSKYEKTMHCLFMTDSITKEHKHYTKIQDEILKYKDIKFQNVPAGFNFGLRMIYHMLFAVLNYEFDYFMRLDDDYFICADKLLYELPMPPLKHFHWGWVHVGADSNIRRPEESIFMVSSDIVHKYLLQNASSLLCHPLADQMIMVWTNALNMHRIFRHDWRLHHHPSASHIPALQKKANICHTYIGLHGAYPKTMLNLWKNRGSEIPLKGNLYNNSFAVTIEQKFCWECMLGKWKFEPRLCMENFKWDTRMHGTGEYAGRSGFIDI